MRDRLVELLAESSKLAGKYIDDSDRNNLPKPKEICSVLADYLLANGVIVPPCKFGDTVYVIPSETNRRLNVIKGFEHLNRVYEQKISKIEIFANNKYLLTTCNGLQSVHCDLYKETWFLTKEEAERALRKDEGK